QTAYNFVLSFFFSLAFFGRFDAFRFHFFTSALVASMTAVLCLTEFAAPLLFPRDAAILGPLPVRPGTVTAARLAALFLPTALTVASLVFIPSILCYWVSGGLAGAILAFVLQSLSGLAVPGVLALAVSLGMRLRGSRDPSEVAPLLQVASVVA